MCLPGLIQSGCRNRFKEWELGLPPLLKGLISVLDNKNYTLRGGEYDF